MSDQKKMGRPPLENAKTKTLHIRVTPEEKSKIKKLAQEKGMSITDLILQGIEKMR